MRLASRNQHVYHFRQFVWIVDHGHSRWRTMRTRSRRVFAWGMAIAGLIQSVQSRAGDDPSAEETSARNQKIKEAMEASVKWYEVLPNAEASTPLTAQVGMRWINASR